MGSDTGDSLILRDYFVGVGVDAGFPGVAGGAAAPGGGACGDFTSINSTSKIKAEFGGMPGRACSP